MNNHTHHVIHAPQFKNYSASQLITRHQMIYMHHFPTFSPSQVSHSSAQSLHKISPRPLPTSHMTIMNLFSLLYQSYTLTLFEMSDSSCLPYHLHSSCSLCTPSPWAPPLLSPPPHEKQPQIQPQENLQWWEFG